MAKSFKPPQSVQNNAKRGLELRKKHGRGGLTTKEAGDEGIGSGVARARDLANGKNVSLETIRRMVNFFNRHEKNKDTPPEKGNGKIAWLLWGGDAGRRWAEGVLKREGKESKSMFQPMTYKAGHTSAMICFFLHPEQAGELAIPGGQPWDELHITLAYLGESSAIDDPDRLLSFIEGFALTQYPIRGRLNGVGRFVGTDDDNDPAVLLYDSPQLPQFRQRLIEGLQAIGVTPSEEHGFIPHITLEYIDPKSPVPYTVSPDPMAFYSINVILGESRFEFPLTGENYMAYRSAMGLNIIESITGLNGEDAEILGLYAKSDGQFYANVRGLVSQATIDAIKQVLPGMVEIKAETEPDGEGWTLIWPGMIGKAGARNSRMDKGRIQAVHDLMIELGAECQKSEAHPIKPKKVSSQNYQSLIQMSEALVKAK